MDIRQVVNVLFQVYYLLLLVRIILSFIRHNPYQPLIRFIYEITEPWLRIFRHFIPPAGMIDFSPIVAFFALELLRKIVLYILSFAGI